jgi:c-di-GMP-related signal transduction protein
MPEDKYLVREPLLDPRQQVAGYRISWQRNAETSGQADSKDLRELLALIALHGNDVPLGLLFLDVPVRALSVELSQARTEAQLVLMLDRSDLVDPLNVAAVTALRDRGFGFALRDVDFAFLQGNEKLLALAAYVEVGVDRPDLAAISSFSRRHQSSFSVVVNQFPGWAEIDTYASWGLHGFFGNLCLKPRNPGASAALGPQSRSILQLMQLVQENADVRHLEKILKQDATLSYKLFHYINSAGFGLVVEIQSLRHAVAMLGYTPLLRWLSVLLAATNTNGFSPALLQAAIIRGRFAELLGHGVLPREESDNLFFVGMFSLLDQLLGISMQEILKEIVLPDAVAQALISRSGVYGPFLELVEACEGRHGSVAEFSDALFMTALHVNQAHLSALAWAQRLKL